MLAAATLAFAVAAAGCASSPPEQAAIDTLQTEPLNLFADTTEAQTAEESFNSIAAAIDGGSFSAEQEQPPNEPPTTVDKQELTPTSLATTTTAADEGEIPTTTPGTAPPGSVRQAPPFAWGFMEDRPAVFPTDCDPAATIVTRPAQPVLGEPFVVRMEATSANGFDFLWWFSLADPRPEDLERAFRIEFNNEPNHVWAEWSVTLHEPGLYPIGAQGRDVLYGTQPAIGSEIGDGTGNQVSEGCGIPYLDIVID